MEKNENYETNLNVREVRAGDELLPRVAPNASAYGVCKNFKKGNYYAHQSIAYRIDSNGQERLLFGIKNAVTADDPIAYVHITDMQLNKKTSNPLNKAYHINDLILSDNNATVIIASSGGNEDKGKSILREYRYSEVSSPFLISGVISPVKERDLTPYFGGAPIDSLCYYSIDKSQKGYIVKGGNRFVFFDAQFEALASIPINDLQDLHGDKIISQTIEYYNGYILQLNSGSPSLGSTENAYINVFRWDGSKVDTYRYSDTPGNLEAKGICSIGNGKYLYTLNTNAEIEVRLLDFNTPSHSHTLSDIFDLKNLGTTSKDLYVNPRLQGNSYLAPDGSKEKPFPNVAEAVAYGKVFLSEGTVYLMDGNYGTVELNNIPISLTFKSICKESCLVDRLKISKCSNLLFEELTFCDSERPFEATSSTIELSNCSFPNGRQSGSKATGTCGVRIAGNSTVTLKECEISHFDAAVDIRGSKLFFEGNKALKGTGNLYGIQGEKSIIWGSKNLTEKVFTVQGMSLTECQSDSDFTAVRGTNGAIRPSDPEKGEFYFDVKANKPLWWNGSDWVDTAGQAY